MSDSEEAKFLSAIVAAPDDTAARTAYADWLAAQGSDARAEYLRIEAQVHALQPKLAASAAACDPAWLAQVQRRVDLLLLDGGPDKPAAIKVIRTAGGGGLKDAMDHANLASESAPRRIAVNLDGPLAQRYVRDLAAVGATGRIVAHVPGTTVTGADELASTPSPHPHA